MAKRETLELEIKTLIGDAQKNVKAMQGELKKLAESARKAAPETKAIAQALNRTSGKEIKRVAAEMKLFGGNTHTVHRQLQIMRDAMIDLVEGGLEPASKEVQTLLKEYKNLESRATQLAKKTEEPIEQFKRLGGAVMQSAAALAFLKGAGKVLGLAGGALEAADAFETTRAEFGILLGDMEAGAGLFEELQAFNIKTPFDLDTIKQGTNMLLAAKTSLSDMTDRLTLFGDLSQGNSQKFISFINAFSKASAKGKADMEVLNVYIDQGVQIFDALGAVVGKSAKEIPKMASEGKISFNDLNRALEKLTAQGGMYYGAMEEGAKSLRATKDALKESTKALSASYGQMLLPAVKSVLKAITGLVNLINDSPLLKGLVATAIMGVVAALGVLAVKTTAAAVAKWAEFAATQALNLARAAANPLILAGVLAVTAAAAAAVAYAAKQQKAAKATQEGALASKQAAQESQAAADAMERQAAAARDAAAAYEQYAESLKGQSIADVINALGQLKNEMDNISNGDIMGRFSIDGQQALKDLEKRIEIASEVLSNKINDKAAAFKEDWNKIWDKHQRSTSSDPYAHVEYERKKKLEEAYLAYVRSANKETIDQINTYYDAQRAKIHANIIMADREVMAKITETRVDDLKLQRDKELASFAGTAKAKAELAKYWERQITKIQKQELDERLAAKQKAELEQYQKTIGGKIDKTSRDALSNTEVGQMAGFGGAAADPLTVAVKALIDFALSIENIQKLLNPIGTLLEGSRPIVERLVNDALQPFIDSLTEAGETLGQFLAPLLGLFAVNLRLLATAVKILLEPLRILGRAFEWLYNKVILPFGNFVIKAINVVIDILNKIPFVNIKRLDSLQLIGQKATEIAKIMEERKKEITAMYQRQKDRVKDELNAQISSLKAQYELGLISRQSYQNQAENYHRQADKEIISIEREMAKTLESIETNTAAALTPNQQQAASFINEHKQSTSEKWGKTVPVLGHVAGAVVDAGKTVLNGIKTAGKAVGSFFKNLFGFASGAPEIPADMIAQIHKGEMIVPRTFAEGVRSGDLSISARRDRGRPVNTNLYVTVNVGGSVIKKDELVDEIHDGLSQGLRSGRLSPLPLSA